MFGLNFLNPFSLGDVVQTSTILWLRFVFVFLVAISSYIAYVYQKPTTLVDTSILYGSYLMMALSVVGLLYYLLSGNVIPITPPECSFCPPIGTAIRVFKSGASSAYTSQVKLPERNPYTGTHVYYFVIQDLRGENSAVDPTQPTQDPDIMSLVSWEDYYRVSLDRITGTLYFTPIQSSGTMDKVSLGKMPLETLCQIAIVQNQKTYAIYVNGKRKATIVSKNLPSSNSLQRNPIFNANGGMNSGIIFHTEIYNTLLDTPDLLRHHESVVAVYTNSSVYQGTPLPVTTPSMNWSEQLFGFFRIVMNLFSYSKVRDTGLKSVYEQNGQY